jgi:hypothetical protein
MDYGSWIMEEEWEERRGKLVECPIWGAQRKGFDGIQKREG